MYVQLLYTSIEQILGYIRFAKKCLPKNGIPMSTIEFFTRFNQMNSVLNNFAYKLTKNLDEAKDLYQETAFRAIKNKGKYRVGTNFQAWLFTIMKNIFINDYRKKKKRNTILDSTDNDFYINSSKNIVSNQAESNIITNELKAMINDLDIALKVPFIMYFNGYKYQEIADHLELPLGTVKSRIFFARKELKVLVNKSYNNNFSLS